MAGMQKVEFIGNFGADPEIRELQDGTKIAKFSVGVTESYKDKSGQKVSNTEWFRCEAWTGLAKVIEGYGCKGMQVFISGKQKTESWEDKEGVKRFGTKIRVKEFVMLGGKSKDNQNKYDAETETNDDLPF